MKRFNIVIEIFYWILIALCPILIGGILGALVYAYVYTSTILFFVFQGFGVLLGIILAEYIRRKYGCSTFYAKLMHTPDLDDNKVSKH